VSCNFPNATADYSNGNRQAEKHTPNGLPVATYAMVYDRQKREVSVNFVSSNFLEVTQCDGEIFREYFKFAKTVAADEREFLSIFSENSLGKSSFLREYEVCASTGGRQRLLDCCHIERASDAIIKYSGMIINRTRDEITDVALRMGEDRLRVALEGSGAGFFDWVRSGGRDVFCDARALELCGMADFSVTVEKLLHAIAPNFLKLFSTVLRDIFSGNRVSFTIEFNLRNNRGRWLGVSGKVIASDPVSKHPLRIAGTVRDITVSKQVAIERERMNDMLEERIRERTAQLECELATKLAAERQLIENLNRERELNSVKSMFVNMVSHEFRTPLAVIQGAVDLLEKYHEKLSDGERIQCLHSVRKAVQRMTRTMDDILVLGKVQTNQLKFAPLETDIFLSCHSILDDVEGLQGNRRIIFKVTPNVPSKLLIDAGLLYHIASNLLSNALKYSPADKPVIFSLNYSGGKLEIFIEDFGIGIPEKDRADIFKIFHRGSNVSQRQGIGVGMFIVKYCINLHQGSIAIASKDGDGTIFRVKLPAAKFDQ
jgi:signal transduction histidine kinase